VWRNHYSFENERIEGLENRTRISERIEEMVKRNVLRSALGAGVVLLVLSGVSQAGMVLFDGWKASWDASLDGLVQITDIGPATIDGQPGYLIQKTAQFTQGPDPLTGFIPEITIQFEQVDPINAVMFIGITQENITNQTGENWIEYINIVEDHGDASFNSALTAASGGGGDVGFSSGQFVNAEWQDSMGVDLWARLRMYNGVVPDGALFQPGGGVNDGTLIIEVNPTGDTVFSLKEFPLIPEPTTMSLLGLSTLIMLRRKKS
jgi:hypothetical protein